MQIRIECNIPFQSPKQSTNRQYTYSQTRKQLFWFSSIDCLWFLSNLIGIIFVPWSLNSLLIEFFQILSQLFLGSRSRKVRCQICSKFRVSKKYKRHLELHLGRGELSAQEMKVILFQSKFTRFGSKFKQSSRKYGRLCTVEESGIPCDTLVLDLKTHLKRQHGITSASDYSIRMDSEELVEKAVFFKQNSIAKSNPLFNFSDQSNEGIDLNLTSHESLDSNNNRVKNNFCQSISSPFDFPCDDIDESHIIQEVSYELTDSLRAFGNHLQTISGGFRSDKSAKMDLSNIVILTNAIGKDYIFNFQRINIHITNEVEAGKSPSTLQSRLYSLERFVKFLKIYEPHILPERKLLKEFKYMIKNARLSLAKLKSIRHSEVMMRNRYNFTHTVDVLKEWRKRREVGMNNYLNLLHSHTSNEVVVAEEIYYRLRDYFIVEIILPNCQRPGVIRGVTIKEVNAAGKKLTKDGLYKVCVAKHKTGYLQNATFFLYPNVFNALLLFIRYVLSKLPHIARLSSKLTQSSPVFQTFNGDSIITSRISPILRQSLYKMGITFHGTVTDIRKAAATLTGKYAPNLHDKMALFLGHSRVAHERYYRVNLGHDGLSEALLLWKLFTQSQMRTKQHQTTIFFL